MSDETYAATLYPGSGLTVEAFTGQASPTPGNVGVCLSGGGSRALSAGMGQLRAMATLESENGLSLLSQTKALSTVSGGSWLGVPFEYQSVFADQAFLGTYVKPQDLTVEELEQLPVGNIGGQVNSGFSLANIALRALLYYKFRDTPADMLWQTVIADQILSPYDLFQPGAREAPTKSFSYDSTSVSQILALAGQNARLQASDFHTFNGTRPFLICNTSMFVEGAEPQQPGDYKYLAPVQCTPFFTGIVGEPGGTDANGKAPGGGGVTSFGFDSTLAEVSDDSVFIDSARLWSILDIVGASSAAFAETLGNLFSIWSEDPALFLETARAEGASALERLSGDLEPGQRERAAAWLDQAMLVEPSDASPEEMFLQLSEQDPDVEALQSTFLALSLTGVVPRYDYWPALNASFESDIQPTMFADGGSLENTGVASMLSYGDIDAVVAFVNSSTPLAPAKSSYGISPSVTVNETTMVVTTAIVVDGQIPPLFGYQPYKDGTYVPYEPASGIRSDAAWGAHNQVFPCTAFSDLLTGLWTAAEGSETPAIWKQSLQVLQNTWFGVGARASIDCVWVYTSLSTAWESLLTPDVKQELDKISSFPNYSTFKTELSEKEVNLLASLTAWSVANDDNKDIFIDLYRNGG